MYRIPLEAIRDNPYQTRTQYGHIEELAESIYNTKLARPETSGLVQVPPARLWDVDGRQPLDPAKMDDLGDLLALLNGGLVVVQLAAGHRRFRAFQHLAGKIEHDGYEYHTFPVELGVYTDEHMADLVWTENHDRDDLSPIEEAEALQRDMQAFGWSQSEIGFRRGLSRPAVANKLRLLNLPDEAQAAIRAGQLTERHGRVLLKARALSEKIYTDLVAEMLLPIVSEEIEAKARELYQKEKYFHIYYSNCACTVCGAPSKYTTGKNIYLCITCFRVVSGWMPPTVAAAEGMLDNVIRQNSQAINFFPLDVQIGKAITGPQIVRQNKCIELDGSRCPALTGEESDPRCIDPECYKFKTESWRGYMRQLLLNNLRQRWPDDYLEVQVIFNERVSYRLDATEETDRYLAQHVCGPNCPRLRLEHFPYDFQHSHYIKLTSDPFAVGCENVQSYRACVRKLGKNQQAQEALAGHNAELAKQEKRKQQAADLRKRAENAIRQALCDGNQSVFESLASLMGDKKAKDPYLVIAKWIANNEYSVFNVPDYKEWDADLANRYKQHLMAWLGARGIALPATADELIERLDKIANFIHGDQPLTAAQISGNVDNLEKLLEEIGQAYTLKTLSEDDWRRMLLRAGDLRGHLLKSLGNVSQETGKIQTVQIDRSEPGYISVEIGEKTPAEVPA